MQIELISLIVLVILSAFFSMSETALFSLSRLKVKHLVDKKKRNAKVIYKLKKNSHDTLITILIGNN